MTVQKCLTCAGTGEANPDNLDGDPIRTDHAERCPKCGGVGVRISLCSCCPGTIKCSMGYHLDKDLDDVVEEIRQLEVPEVSKEVAVDRVEQALR